MPHSSAIHPSIPHHVYVRIVDEQGHLLVESAPMLPLPPLLNFPIIDQQNPDTIEIIKAKSNDNQLYLLGSAWVTTQNTGQSHNLLLQVILELAQDETLLTEYQRTLARVLLFGALASGLAGFWVTRCGLCPLSKITETIQNINAHQTEVYTDPGLLRRILSNLISNALHFTNPQGMITLSAVYFPNHTVTITINDTGEGIDPEILPHIFDRFFRADKSRHQENQGSGLGLVIVKSIMELHNGDISISSQLHQGTTVQLNFPVI